MIQATTMPYVFVWCLSMTSKRLFRTGVGLAFTVWMTVNLCIYLGTFPHHRADPAIWMLVVFAAMCSIGTVASLGLASDYREKERLQRKFDQQVTTKQVQQLHRSSATMPLPEDIAKLEDPSKLVLLPTRAVAVAEWALKHDSYETTDAINAYLAREVRTAVQEQT